MVAKSQRERSFTYGFSSGFRQGYRLASTSCLRRPRASSPSRRSGRRLRLAAAMLGTPSEGIRRDFTESVREGNGELRKWLKLALVEKSVARKHIEALRQAATSSFEILAMIDVMDRDVEAALPTPLRERLILTLEAMARILDDGGYPIDIEFEDSADGEPSLPPCAAAILASIREALIAYRRGCSKRTASRRGCSRHATSRTRKEVRRVLFARRVHQSRACPLRAQDHRGRHALLHSLFVA